VLLHDRTAVQHELSTAAGCEAMGGCYYGEGAVFQAQEKVLAADQVVFDRLPVLLLDHAGEETKIGPGGKCAWVVIADDQGTEVAGALFDHPFEHVEDCRRKTIHLGMQLEAGDATAEIPDGGGIIAVDRRCRSLRRGEHRGGEGGCRKPFAGARK